MPRLVRLGRAHAAAAFFDRHGPAVADHLSQPQRTLLDALMEYADTVVELEALVPEGAKGHAGQFTPSGTAG